MFGTLMALKATDGDVKESLLSGAAIGIGFGPAGVLLGSATGAEMRYDLWSNGQPHRKIKFSRNPETRILVGASLAFQSGTRETDSFGITKLWLGLLF